MPPPRTKHRPPQVSYTQVTLTRGPFEIVRWIPSGDATLGGVVDVDGEMWVVSGVHGTKITG